MSHEASMNGLAMNTATMPTTGLAIRHRIDITPKPKAK